MHSKSIAVVLAMNIAFGFACAPAIASGPSDPRLVSPMPTDHPYSEQDQSKMTIALGTLLDRCSDLAGVLNSTNRAVMSFHKSSDGGMTDLALANMGWVAAVTIKWEGGNDLNLYQTLGGEGLGGVYAYGAGAQAACGLATVIKGQSTEPFPVRLID